MRRPCPGVPFTATLWYNERMSERENTVRAGKGRLITLEGGEGSGKSTQVKRLVAALRECGREVVVVREPGGTPLAEEVRRLLKDQEADVPVDRAELLLFLAARAQLVERVIRPALAQGKWVVSDRFSDSTLAYQGYGRGLDLELIRRVNAFACSDLKPDLTLLLDVDPEVSASRMRRREGDTATSADRIERAGAEFHARLRQGFRRLAAAEPERIVVIDANRDETAVWEDVWMAMKRFN